jgi:putative YphP/YqiW family bacilliredoxin
MSHLNMMPTYDPVAVQPMRDELTLVGFQELLTPEDVDKTFGEEGKTVLVLINSVCGCAAGNARPGASIALQNDKIPDSVTTVFAGQDKAAVQRVREYLSEYPPSSPCIALLKDKKVLHILERRHIENKTAIEVATELKAWFDDHCSSEGPSIPAEEFEKLTPYKGCGSQIPLL